MKCTVVFLVHNDAFVDVNRFIQVLPVEVDGGHAEEVLGRVVQHVVHHVVVVALALTHVELDARIQTAVGCVGKFLGGIVDLAQFVETQGPLDMHFKGLRRHGGYFVLKVQCFALVVIVAVAVGQPHQGFYSFSNICVGRLGGTFKL